MQPTHPIPADSTASSRGAGVSRRRLIRAGASAMPVLATLKANAVLAGGNGGHGGGNGGGGDGGLDHTCIRPSSFASLSAANWKLSQGREIKTDYTCYSHGHWKKANHGLPEGFKSRKFLSCQAFDSGFTRNPDGFYTGKSFQDVLNTGGNESDTALARHVVAMYLSAISVQNDPNRVTLTIAQCNELWNTRGVWSPFAGANWDYATTLAYLEKLLGAKFL